MSDVKDQLLKLEQLKETAQLAMQELIEYCNRECLSVSFTTVNHTIDIDGRWEEVKVEQFYQSSEQWQSSSDDC